MSILYIDDDIEDIEIFQEALKAVDPGIEYISASSAQEGLKILETADSLPDHIVLDINMPGMDGKMCLNEIRKEKKFDDVSVVIYSTNGFPKDIEYIQSRGAIFIRKVNSFNELCGIIQSLISRGERKSARA
ncbi:MAG: response regulator [Bacteroidota bacterium]|nr:response regulator [Bacteroidota bacterium]